jgi:uncharacterized protein YndB with AHSA1/START domain
MADTEITFEPGQQDIVVRRTFDAPPRAVFAAITDPQLIPNWWGARRFETSVDRMEVRPGGSWRFLVRNRADGTEYPFRGVYHDIVANEKIVTTFEFEPGGPGYLQLVVDTFEELSDGRTAYTNRSLFQSVEDRDGWIPTDMSEGIRQSMDLLDQQIQARLGARS